MSAYALGQVGRNAIDLKRVLNRSIEMDTGLNREQKDELMAKDPHLVSHDDIQKIGELKIEKIIKMQRIVYAGNIVNFSAMAVGGGLTLAALVIIASGGTAAFLIPGIVLVVYGAVTTGVSNNIFPAKWKPRNGELGVDRNTLSLETCAAAIGERRELKTILKTAKKEKVPKQRGRNVWFKFVSSLPFGNKYAQKKLHKRNEKRFSHSMARLETIRATTLEKLWSVKKFSLANGDSLNFDTNDLSDQLQICEKLGIKEMVLKRFSEKITGSDDCGSCSAHENDDHHGHHHHHHHGCFSFLHNRNHHHHHHLSSEDYKKKLVESGAYEETHGVLRLKDVSDFSKVSHVDHHDDGFEHAANDEGHEHDHEDESTCSRHDHHHLDLKKLLGQCIDYTLYWEYKNDLKYQQQGLYDYYFALRDAEENRSFLGFKRRRKVIAQDSRVVLNPLFDETSV